MSTRVVPSIHKLPPLVCKILSDLYGQFAFINSAYYPLVATSVVAHDIRVDHSSGIVICESTSKWYWDSEDKPLRTVLTFQCNDTVLFADVFVNALETETCTALIATGQLFLGHPFKEIQHLGQEMVQLGNDIAKPQIRIKLRCLSDVEHNSKEEKVISLVTNEQEWLQVVENTVKPMVRYAVERDRALDVYDGPEVEFLNHEYGGEPMMEQ